VLKYDMISCQSTFKHLSSQSLLIMATEIVEVKRFRAGELIMK
jgi:hypothetical protein